MQNNRDSSSVVGHSVIINTSTNGPNTPHVDLALLLSLLWSHKGITDDTGDQTNDSKTANP